MLFYLVFSFEPKLQEEETNCYIDAICLCFYILYHVILSITAEKVGI
jgi:hypothetical protein